MPGRDIPIRIQELANIRRDGEVVTVGVPFRKGYARPESEFAVCDASGEQQPTQWRTLATWDDGSVQRALFHFFASSGERDTGSVSIVESAPPAPPQAVSAIKNGTDTVVDTGRIRFRVRADRFRLFSDLFLNGECLIGDSEDDDGEGGPPLGLFTVDADGRSYSAATCPSVAVEIEEQGPLHAVLCCRGQHTSADDGVLLDFEARILAKAGSPTVKLYHTFINRSDSSCVDVSEIGLSLCLAGVDGGTRVESDWRGEATLQGRAGGLIVKMEHFGEQHPKRMESDGRRINVWFRPACETVLTLTQGIAKTHVLHLACFGDEEQAQKNLWSSVVPLQATVPCEWFNETDVMSRIMPRRAEKYPWLELLLQDSFRWAWEMLPDQLPDLPFNGRDFPCKRIYGMLGFGDYSRAGRQFCQHLEHDIPHAFFLQYLRLAEPAYRQAMEDTVLHMMDVDVCHHRSPDAEYNGKCYMPGGLYQHNPAHNEPPEEARMTISHIFLEGILDYYFLTGYSRAREVAVGIAENLLKNIPTHYDHKTLARHHGWPLVAMCAIYRATGDRRYLEHCETMVAFLKEWQDERGCFPRHEGTDPGLGPFALHDGRPFGIGVMLKGVAAYYRVNPSRDLRDFFLEAVDGAIRTFECPEGLLQSTGVEKYTVMMESMFILDAFALAYELTGERKYLEKGLFNLRYGIYHWWKYDDMRDTLRMTSLLIAVFPFLHVADEAGMLEDIRFI